MFSIAQFRKLIVRRSIWQNENVSTRSNIRRTLKLELALNKTKRLKIKIITKGDRKIERKKEEISCAITSFKTLGILGNFSGELGTTAAGTGSTAA